MQQTPFHSAAGCKGNQTETSRNGRALLISPLNNSEAFSYLLETGRKNGTIRKSCYIIFFIQVGDDDQKLIKVGLAQNN